VNIVNNLVSAAIEQEWYISLLIPPEKASAFKLFCEFNNIYGHSRVMADHLHSMSYRFYYNRNTVFPEYNFNDRRQHTSYDTFIKEYLDGTWVMKENGIQKIQKDLVL